MTRVSSHTSRMFEEDQPIAELWRSLREVPAVPHALRRQLPQVLWHGDTSRRAIALTFDDGPDPRDTLPILEALARQRTRATFCYIGERAAAHPALVALAASAGHQLGVHGYRHVPFIMQTSAELRQSLDRTRDLLTALSNRTPEAVSDVRPPYGLITPALAHTLIGWGYRPLIGGVVPMHWLQPAERTIAQVLRYACPGAIVVLHESLGGPAIAPIVAALIEAFRAQGYDFLTVEEMRRSRGEGADTGGAR